MSELHEVVFRWPYNANEVIVTGTFDQWASSIRLNKGPTGFTTTVRVHWAEKVLYKFIVDGKWTTIDQAPTEVDWRGNVNNVYNAPTKPQDVTPLYERPAAKVPKIAPVPAPVPVEEKKEVPTPTPQPTKLGSVEVPAKPKEEPVKDETPVVDKKEPSPPVDEKVTPSVPEVAPIPIVPVNDTKPVDTPPAKTEEPASLDKAPTTVLPTPANPKAPLFFVPVNDSSTADKQPPAVEPIKHTDTPSTHALPINSPRKPSTGTSSSNTLLTEKKEEEKKETRPEEARQHSGSSYGREPAKQLPSTPPRATTPALPATPGTPTTFSSPPTTPRKSYFRRSAPSSPSSSSSGDSIAKKDKKKKKRESLISKVKHLFTPEKDKKEHKREKSHG
jgi:hypothetical protein